MRISFKTVIKNIFRLAIIVALFAGFGYIAFYLPSKRSEANKAEIQGIVRDKWVDIIESETGARFSPKILLETKTGDQSVIRVDRKIHAHIKIGTFIKRNENSEFEIEQ